MALSSPPLVPEALIRRIMGGGSFERGRSYAVKGMAHGLSWNEGFSELSGHVRGSDRSDYRTRVRFTVSGDHLTNPRGSCTCPMQVNCKHVAALVVTSNASNASTNGAHHTTSMSPAAVPAPNSRRLPNRTGTELEQVPPPWQRSLDRLVTSSPRAAAASRGYGSASLAPALLGLRFELRADKSGSSRRTHGAPSATPVHQNVRLIARPVQRNAADQWVTGQLNWDAFRWAWYGGNFDPQQREWMRALAAVSDDDALTAGGLRVDAVSNPVVWDLLARGPAMGITLLAAKDAPLTLHDAVAPVLDVTSPRSRLLVRPRVTIGDDELDIGTVGVIGSPAHGLFWWGGQADDGAPLAGRSIGLAPTTAPLPPVLESLIRSRRPLEIPGTGREAFLTSYYPKLRQHVQVVSSDASVSLPDVPPPTLVLTVRYVLPRGSATRRERRPEPPASDGSVVLDWAFEYAFAGTTTAHGLEDDGAGHRDHAVERQQLGAVGAVLEQTPTGRVELRGMAGARFVAESVPRLQELDHVRVELGEDVPAFEEVTDRPAVSIGTTDTDTRDWFDLAVAVHLAGTEVPFDQLFRALAEGQEHLLLADGRYFALNQPEFVQLRRLIEEARLLQDGDSDGLRISRYQAGLWDELLELADDAEQSLVWRESVAGLLDLTSVEQAPVPQSIDATLRPYQEQGFAWLAFLWDHGLGGVLADDMGLGKTLQTLSLICHTHANPHGSQSPFLVVAPTSVVPNWAAEARRFAPGLRVTAISDTLRRSKADLPRIVEENDVVVVSYTLFRLDYEAYAAQSWAGLILDEAQFVKNPATKASQHARTFPAPFKLAITGTPMENNLMELWSLFAITAPGLFPSAKVFSEYYQRPIERESDAERLAQLRRRIRPLILRRTKELVATELPPKQEQVLELELSPKHRTIYQRHLQRERQKVLGLLDDMDRNRFEIFRSLTMLRRLCLDASLVDAKYASTPSSKLDVLFEQLEDIVAEGHRALIFSQFTGFLGKAAERLTAAGIEYAYLDGSTRKRGAVIEKFKSGSAPVFLISLKAGGFGLNLAEADYCFLLDPWWNPASENQAVDRAHRIGQQRQVMVYRLVAKDTIEEKVMALKEQKAKLFAAVMDDDAMFSSALTAGDIRGLFE